MREPRRASGGGSTARTPAGSREPGDGARAAAVRVLRTAPDWSLPAAAWQPRTHPARATVATALGELARALEQRDGTAFAAALGDLRRLAARGGA
ncbi:CATRA system-associated protein, partial [Frankia sp. AgB32]|uniref:CATRA system-associated protein n=1 Tax=Frankia sp. AgB32 TaxID=631119 RepID=UPI00200E09BC